MAANRTCFIGFPFIRGLREFIISGVTQSGQGFDDGLFSFEVSLALYLWPLLLSGLGINIISDILNRHLASKKED